MNTSTKLYLLLAIGGFGIGTTVFLLLLKMAEYACKQSNEEIPIMLTIGIWLISSSTVFIWTTHTFAMLKKHLAELKTITSLQ